MQNLEKARKLAINKEQREFCRYIELFRSPNKRRPCVIDNLEFFFVHLLFFLDLHEEILSHQRVRFPFPINSRAEKMNNLGRTEYRVNILDAMQVIIGLANLAIPFSRQFLHRKTEQLVCLIKGNLIRVNALRVAILVQLVPLIEEFPGLGRIAGKDNPSIEKHFRQRKRKSKNVLVPVVAFMLDMVRVVFMGMQIGNAADIARVIDFNFQLVNESRVYVKI